MLTLVGALVAFGALVAWERLIARGVPGRADLPAFSRRVLYLMPALFVFVLPPAPEARVAGSVALLVCVIAVGVSWALSFREFRRALEFAQAGLAPQTRTGAVLVALNLAAGPLVQEPVHRALLLWPLAAALSPAPAILLTATLFTAEHRLHPAASTAFRRADYVRQFTIGVVLGWASLASGVLGVTVIGHALFNLPPLALQIARVRGTAEEYHWQPEAPARNPS